MKSNQNKYKDKQIKKFTNDNYWFWLVLLSTIVFYPILGHGIQVQIAWEAIFFISNSHSIVEWMYL